jgi:hypothetical protein
MADKYCCFLHPKKDYSLKELTDVCPDCGKPYDFPLRSHPKNIREFNIEGMAGRGFYGVTYRATRGRFGDPRAVKVIPKAVYQLFGKDFAKECQSHYELAQNTEHLAQIEDAFDEDVAFGDVTLPCHVAVLRWIDGKTLHEMLVEQRLLEATVVAQIALDLMTLLNELQRGGKRHNDLHKKNIVIEYNKNAPPRTDRIRADFRAVAVDFGSIDDASLSGDARIGDLANVGHHIRDLTRPIRERPAAESDLNWRLASALDQTARSLLRDPTSQRLSFADLRSEIETLAIYRARTPVWRSSLQLKSLSEHYNAQTIESAYVPNLLVLPEHSTWTDQVRTPGPQVISGMRGCGKTMLLKSMDFHAQAFRRPKEVDENVVARLTKERFVGLFLACAKLLDQSNRSPGNLHVRLLVGYALAAHRVSQHLRDLKPSAVDPRFPAYIAQALAECLTPAPSLPDNITEFNLEEFLVRTQLRLGQDDFLGLKSSPVNVFPVFAQVFARISPEVFGDAHVLFLLDDVSTRFISEETIAELISALLFSSEKCSFKFTTEAQTLELVLKSPGRIEHAQQGRDYTVFNLGSEVSRLIRGRGSDGKKFIADILEKRSEFQLRKLGAKPHQILGDQRLSDIAVAIGKAFEIPEGRKKIYWGLSALTNLCVGDVGEVVRLYEDILKQAKPGEFPVPSDIQHKCFQHICASALHDVNRRNTKFKDHAIGFANAAHKLLRKSLALSDGKPKRVRQYAQVYVSISTGNQEGIFKEIRELVDAGIYTLDSSTAAPRTKRVNADPMQQFILTYRKLYGLSTLIGLAYRDRFELSGQDLETWLRNPAEAEDVFLRNEGGADEQGDAEEDAQEEALGIETDETGARAATDTVSHADSKSPTNQIEMQLWSQPKSANKTEEVLATEAASDALGVVIEEVASSAVSEFDLIIGGLGIEERCEESLSRLVKASRNRAAVLVQFPLAGRANAIQALFNQHRIPTTIVSSEGAFAWQVPNSVKNVMIDISGLAKPAIFHFCRHILEQHKSVYVCHTQALNYYPSDQDLAPVLKAHSEDDVAQLLEGVADVFKGEDKPYKRIPLLEERQDDSRPRALIAFAAAKHERLLTLIDARFYDYVGIAFSSAKTGRGRISEMAARFAVRNVNGAACYPVSSTDLTENIEFLARLYSELYHQSGYNVEIGLTGSKVCGLAAAILAARWKIAQAWYVKPARFSGDRFTTGVGPSRIYRISIHDDSKQSSQKMVGKL